MKKFSKLGESYLLMKPKIVKQPTVTNLPQSAAKKKLELETGANKELELTPDEFMTLRTRIQKECLILIA